MATSYHPSLPPARVAVAASVCCMSTTPTDARPVRSMHRRARRATGLAVTLFAVAAVLLAGCGGDATDDSTTSGASDGGTTTAPTAPAENAGQEVERFNDPTGTVAVPVGQVFQITLDADAEACFSWDLKTTDSDIVTLETSRPSAIATQDDPALVGASKTDVFEFSAAKAGSVDLKFEEISPCDPGTTRDTRTITVTVS